MTSLNKVTILAPAKINLFLHVVGKTQNNYHLLQSLVYFSDFGDQITIEPNDEFLFSNIGNQIPKQNSVVNVAKKLSDILNYPLNCKITLDKKIPMGGGIGGGSSDAAATVKTLLKFWSAKIEQETLNKLLLSFGADVPCCYMAQAGYFEGIGEHVTPLTHAPELYAVLCNPNKHSATENIFKDFSNAPNPTISLPDGFHSVKELIEFLKTTDNDLTEASCQNTPEIREILEVLRAQESILLHRMSGSGSTCFALLSSKEQALNLEKKLHSDYPHWWSQSVTLN